jgi:hypothetical protein
MLEHIIRNMVDNGASVTFEPNPSAFGFSGIRCTVTCNQGCFEATGGNVQEALLRLIRIRLLNTGYDIEDASQILLEIQRGKRGRVYR